MEHRKGFWEVKPFPCFLFWWWKNDPGAGVMKDPSKAFFFHDVLNFILKEYKWIHLHAEEKRNKTIISNIKT